MSNEYTFIESPNQSSRQNNQISGLIAHFTAGGSLDSTVKYMCNKIEAPSNSTGSGFIKINDKIYYNSKVSAHYITGRIENGVVKTIQMVLDDKAAWHAGSSTTTPLLNGKKNLNLWTIGHEICNLGGLREFEGKFFSWQNNWTKKYVGITPINIPKLYNSEVIKSYKLPNGSLAFPDGIIKYWEPYQDEQIVEIIKLWKMLIDKYKIGKEWISGHESVDPTRKIDPGPAFPWDHILSELF